MVPLFIFSIVGSLTFGFVLGVEFWKRRGIMKYELGYQDALEDVEKSKKN